MSRTVVAAVAMTVLLAGCAAPQPAPTESGAAASPGIPEAPPTPAANAYTDAVIHTRSLGTAAIDVVIETSVDSVARITHGTGAASIDRGLGAITWTADDGRVSREVSNGKGLYVQEAVPDGMWTHLDSATATPTGRLADPLRGLGSVSRVTPLGHDTVAGGDATGFHGSIPADAAAMALLGLPDDTVTALQRTWPGTDIDITVWINDRSEIVRIDRAWSATSTPLGPVSARTTTRLSDFVSLITIDPPPSESVIEPAR